MAWLENFGNEVFVREMRFNTNPREKNWKCNDTSFLNSKGILFLAPIKIKKVIFNDPATIVMWTDGTKTVVKANNEPFDKEKGLAMAICKKACDNKGNFNNIFKRHCHDEG